MTQRRAAGNGDDGPEKPKGYFVGNNLAYAAWGGQPCNPYDTERVPRGSSSGSGVAVAANLGACSFCEQSGGSCMGPASRNGIVSMLTTKGVLMDGGYGYQSPGDRAGIYCRTLADAVKVLDVVKGFETTDIYSALPKAIIPKEPYASFLLDDSSVPSKPLKGMRIAIVREFMVKHAKNDAAISRPDRQGDQGGAARQARRRARGVGGSAVSGRSVRAQPEVHVPGRDPRDLSAPTCPSTSGRRARTASSSSRCRAGT